MIRTSRECLNQNQKPKKEEEKQRDNIGLGDNIGERVTVPSPATHGNVGSRQLSEPTSSATAKRVSDQWRSATFDLLYFSFFDIIFNCYLLQQSLSSKPTKTPLTYVFEHWWGKTNLFPKVDRGRKPIWLCFCRKENKNLLFFFFFLFELNRKNTQNFLILLLLLFNKLCNQSV